MIQKFISGLNDKEKKVLLVTSLVVLAAVFDNLFVRPTLTKLHSIRQDINKEENLIKQDLRFLVYKDRILQESQSFTPYYTKVMPKEEEIISGFLKKVELLASRSNVTLVKLPPPSGEKEREFVKYSTDLECTGKLTDIIRFMHQVNTAPDDLLKVVKFKLGSAKADSEEMKSSITIAKMIVSPQRFAEGATPKGAAKSVTP